VRDAFGGANLSPPPLHHHPLPHNGEDEVVIPYLQTILEHYTGTKTVA